MRESTRALLTLVAAMLAAPAAHWLFAEAAFRYELWATGAQSAEKLSEDFGLAVLWVIAVLPAKVVATVLTGWLVWRRLGGGTARTYNHRPQLTCRSLRPRHAAEPGR